MMVIYFDSMIIIYLLDHVGPFNMRALGRVEALVAAGDQAAVSDLSRLECRVRPLRLGDNAKLADFADFFSRQDVRVLSITTAVFDRATWIRATYNFKLADSLHLAAAVEYHCDRFLTNDSRVSTFSDIPVEVLP